MSLRVSGKNMDIGTSLREHVEGRISDAVSKYFDGGYSGHVTVEREGSGFRTECMIHLDTGVNLQTSARHNSDPTLCFDQSADKIEKRLRRYKRKLKDHGHHQKANEDPAASFIIETTDEKDELPEDYNPVIIAETETSVLTMNVGTAVMQLDLTEAPVVVFRNPGHGGVNVVYRRADGHIGWIDPAEVKTKL